MSMIGPVLKGSLFGATAALAATGAVKLMDNAHSKHNRIEKRDHRFNRFDKLENELETLKLQNQYLMNLSQLQNHKDKKD